MMATRLRKKSNEWMKELLKDKHFKTALNLGCGEDVDQEGNFYSNYFKWDKIIKIDKIKYTGVMQASAENLPLEDNSVDFIFSNWMLYFLSEENRIKAVSEMKRVLKPKGKILISSWALDIKELKSMMDLFNDFQILDTWKLDCEQSLDLRAGKAEMIYGVKNGR